jgi:integrase
VKGCRAFSDPEIDALIEELGTRDRAFFLLGLHTGFRISEILSLKVRDVLDRHGLVTDRIEVARRHMKGKRQGRSVILHPRAAEAIGSQLEQLKHRQRARPHHFIFRSYHNGGLENRPITRRQAWRILRETADRLGFIGRIGTHSMRKTFAARFYKASGGDLIATQAALDHESVDSTARYLGIKTANVDRLVLAIYGTETERNGTD